jgi:hypothetical protein
MSVSIDNDGYIKEYVNPLFEPLVSALLTHKPSNPVKFKQ